MVSHTNLKYPRIPPTQNGLPISILRSKFQTHGQTGKPAQLNWAFGPFPPTYRRL